MVDNAKGVRDFPPEDKILREELVSILRSVFENFGFSPFETPSIERLDTLTAKFAAGEGTDTSNEIFKLSDQGNRELGLRFDLTVPLSRFVAMNPTLKMPFRRYEIGRVFRDGPIKLGRYREFWQCDVDIVGSGSMRADAEIILLALEAFSRLKIDAFIEVNNRKILFGILDACNIKEAMRESVIISVDKLAKQGESAVKKELSEKGVRYEDANRLLEILSMSGDNASILERLKEIITSDYGIEGLKELEELFLYLGFVLSGRIVFNPALARGLNYYTSTVFEGFLRESRITSSICGGGRYDNMIGMFASNNRQYPAVGIAFGLEPICDALKLAGIKTKKSVTQLYIIPINTFKESLEIASGLRRQGLCIEIDLTGKGVSKNLDYANSLGIPFVAFIGESELSEGKIKLKNMKSGKEEMLTAEGLVKRIREGAA